jgi:AcrR family transcriptional regulator
MTGRKNPEQIGDKKSRILDAVPKHLLDHGPRGPWLAYTARALETSPNAVTYYFASAQQLIFELHNLHMRDAFERAKTHEDWPGTPQDVLRFMAEALLLYFQENAARHQVFMQQRQQLTLERQNSLAWMETHLRFGLQLALHAIHGGELAQLEPAAGELLHQLLHRPLWAAAAATTTAPIATTTTKPWLERLISSLPIPKEEQHAQASPEESQPENRNNQAPERSPQKRRARTHTAKTTQPGNQASPTQQ